MRRLTSLVLVVVLCVISLLGAAPTTHAAPDLAQGMQISPVLVDLNTDRGKTYDLKISVMNVTTGDLVFSSFINDFQAKDETGDPEVLIDTNLPESASLVKWVKPLGPVALKAKQSKDLIVRVTIPADAEPGGHYGVVRFSGTAPGLQQNGVSLAASAGMLLLVRVSGNIKESLITKDFFTERGDRRSVWFENGPIKFVQRITNNGNVHVKPLGDVVITSMTGSNIGTVHVNDKKGNILPGSTRRFEETLNKKRLFGRYTATASLAYGTQGQVLIASTTFWVIPYKLIIAALLLIILLVLLLRFMLRRYNQKVIKKAQRETNRRNFR